MTRSVSELHGYFKQAREAWDAVPAQKQDRAGASFGRCELFGRRLIRAPARSLTEVLLKIEVAEWLGDEPAAALAVIREDIFRLQGNKV